MTYSKLTGTNGNDILIVFSSNTGNYILSSFAGIDRLVGGVGNDQLIGGMGADILWGGAGDDIIFQELEIGVNDLIYGDAGVDTVDYSQSTVSGSRKGIVADLSRGKVYKNGTSDTRSVDKLQGIENVVGTALNDLLIGDANANVLTGGAGNDEIWGNEGNDQLIGGAGADALFGGAGDDIIFQNLGDLDLGGVDYIRGGIGVDTVDYSQSTVSGGMTIEVNLTTGKVFKYKYGLSGTIISVDTLDGIENVVGTAWDDTLTGDANANVLKGMAGNDVLAGNAGNDILEGGAGDDILTGGAGADTLFGDAGDDIIFQNLGDLELGGLDYILGGIGVDTVDYSQSTVSGGMGIIANLTTGKVYKMGLSNTISEDKVYEIENVVGTALNDTLKGDANANVLKGGAGYDQLIGGTGADTLWGGEGDDWIFQELEKGVNDTIDGGAGVDTVNYSQSTVAGTVGIVADLGANTVYKNGLSDPTSVDALYGIENVVGTAWADALTGDANANVLKSLGGDDVLSGGAGNDILEGGAGNDQLTGGAGADKLYGGDGDDIIFQVLEAGVSDSIDGGAGVDTADYSQSTVSGGGIVADLSTITGGVYKNRSTDTRSLATLQGIENVVGTAWADTLTGDANANVLKSLGGDDVLSGGAGNDILEGGAGNDQLTGGAGADKLYGGDGDDIIFQVLEAGVSDSIDGGAGVDTADYSQSTVSGGGIVADLSTITGGVYKNRSTDTRSLATLQGIENVVGTAWADTLTGDANANVLMGGAGDDQLTGGAGNDQLTGGKGADKLYGGDGDDIIFQELESWVSDTIVGGAGVDTVDYSQSTRSGTVGLLSVVGIFVYLPHGWVYKDGMGYATTRDALYEIENVVGTAFADDLTGDANANVLTGLTGSDNLNGDAGDDRLEGGAGDDRLVGGTGNDVLIGGVGFDRLVGDAGDDIIFQEMETWASDIIVGGAGVDTVDYSRSTVSDNVGIVANLSASTAKVFKNGISADPTCVDTLYEIENVVGTAFADTLKGDANANVLKGLAGNDVLVGNAGDDYLDGGTGNDMYKFNIGWGQDTVVDTDATVGNTDTLVFGSGITRDQLWFSQVGNDLTITRIGSNDAIRVQNWYSGINNQVEELTLANGGTLLSENVAKLVQAMSQFAPPAAGQTTLPQNYQTALASVIASTWK